MKLLTKENYKQLRRYIYRHARHLDVVRWQYFFEGGSKQTVLDALSFYQNEDGGFGYGLEIDNQNPHSSPVQTGWAYSVLEEIECDSPTEPMVQDIIRYYENCEYVTELGSCWSIPTNNHYPCQPWYFYPNASEFPTDWPPENYGNHYVIEFAFKCCDKSSVFYQKILKMIGYRLSIMPKFSDISKV